MKRAMPVHKKIGTPGEAVIRKSNSVYDGGRSSSGCLSLHCEERRLCSLTTATVIHGEPISTRLWIIAGDKVGSQLSLGV